MLSYSPTPVQEVSDPILDKAGVRLLVKREDLNHPLVSGNKWWKLKYNLEEAARQNRKMLLTFGGAYSNHIFATAAAARECGFESTGIIRGEETLPLNNTLSFAQNKGMKLHYVSREDYRDKKSPAFVKELHERFGDFYLIPEGGTNELAVKGVTEFAQALETDFNYLCCPVGTGGTLAGLINGLPEDKIVIGFSSLKGGDFLHDEVRKWLKVKTLNWQILTGYDFGGYGKVPDKLISFQREFESDRNISLDLIYGAKMMYGVLDLASKNYFRRGSTLLALHTGGLQGNASLTRFQPNNS